MKTANQRLVDENRELRHQVQLQQTLRDQFKTFVKENISAFDLSTEFSLQPDQAENTASTVKSVSPKPRKPNHDTRETTLHAKQAERQAQATISMKRRKDYSDRIRQQQQQKSRSRTPVLRDESSSPVPNSTKVLDLSRARKHKHETNPNVKTESLLKQLKIRE